MANILIADDDPTARDLATTVLGYAGHRLREAADGAEALTSAEAEPPDLFIVDLLMPTMDGFEFVRRLRDNPAFARTPVIFYSATYLESEALSLARSCGVRHIINKPAEPQEILDKVSAALGVPQAPVPPPPLESFRREHLTLLTAKLSQRVDRAVPRLQAMIEFGLTIASEREPPRLLQAFCGAARKIIGAKYALVGVLEADGTLCFRHSSGMASTITRDFVAPDLRMPVAEGVLSEQRARRFHGLPGDPAAVGLPPGHPPVHSFLGAPIASPDRAYGWLCLSDKIGASEFTEEDEGLAQILAAQVGRIYENGTLYYEIERYVGQLESEVAKRRRAQEEVEKLNAQLERRVARRTAELGAAYRELEAFSYSVSHDLRAPLRGVTGFCGLLLKQHGPELPEGAQEYVRRIDQAASRMDGLIDDLLDLSRVNQRQLRRARIDLSRMARTILDELRASAPERKVAWEVADGIFADADAHLLRSVMENLLGNAWRFTSKTRAAKIEVGSRSGSGGACEFFVRDNGDGFDMKYVDQMFGAFQRLHTESEFPGTGIGLAIVRRIIRRHGGEITAEGERGKGAAFYFTLPARSGAESESDGDDTDGSRRVVHQVGP